MFLSSTSNVPTLAVIVSPDTVKSPVTTKSLPIVTTSSVSPIVTAFDAKPEPKAVFKFATETLSTAVLPARAVEPDVPSCNVVTEPPSETAEPSTVIELFASLAFAIDPANCAFVIVPPVSYTHLTLPTIYSV